ncbi:hypothetical protein PG984_015842 [Apiospora sp. TS-2023a]
MPQETETPAAAAAAATATVPADPATAHATMPQSFRGLNHLKLASVDLNAIATFYTTIFPFTYLPHYDHHRPDGSVFAVMFRHEASGILVEARQNPAQAAAQVGWDPVTWGVDTRADLEAWARWLDSRGVDHSRVLRGVKGWVLCARDPDGKIVRLYTEEEHEWALPEEDEVWLGSLEDK